MLVSIIIPVYNAEKYLNKCLDSLVNQTYKDIEIICVNDGSKDNSLDILHEYDQKYPNMFTIIDIPNGGQANARNIGLDVAKGEYVFFVDSDDYIDVTTIEKMMVHVLETNCDIVCCSMERIFDGDFNGFTKNFQYDTKLDIHGLTNIHEHKEIVCFLTAAVYSKLVRKSFLDDNGIRFKKGYIYEDLLFTQTMLSYDPSLYLMDDPFYKYFVRQNTTMTSKKSKVEDMFFIFDTLYNNYKERNLDVELKDELEFLCLYHILVGTSFRMFSSKQFSLFQAISRCHKEVRRYHCGKSNKYISKKGFITKLFVLLFA